ncbi:serine/threonine-protein kinase ppk30 [Plectosphaerella plurivora]|uniref:non-specific serine/threonine protein kinase n=1 Tax=Plectosphaerella plurivora TaxID=936078 RepID=A0A9P9AB78_9PEZI|nr:serine/threonine-protein kinase ppk30 [Plectosphaerella plurivora]
MAHHGHQMAARPAPAAYGAPVAIHAPAAPAGTFAPGTKIQVGSHRVIIQKYLSEGGFAHVYLVKLPKPFNGTDLAVLKRVAVPDKEALKGMRIEVETMKRLKGHKPIVFYMDSHASEMRGGGYEVFLLMEYCNGGGLIDFMNTRLQHRLTEPEILQIFTDIAEGVACMHYLKPPLLHRDLKVENVLITTDGTKRRFKLCDFGSASPPKPAPQTVVECRLLDEDVQKHTTMQYRSPEMIDVYRKQPIDEKSDIWALGVLLYKLCYYTTPFEDQGQLAILNASYKFHTHPNFSDRLKRLIASMLREDQKARPNIYQVLKESCAMQNRAVPIHDIYSGASRSDDAASATSKPSPAPVVGATFSPPPQEKQSIPDITPMRRGRVPLAAQAPPHKPSPSPGRVTSGDPFAALDTKAAPPSSAQDELSSRFPSLDQFSLLHDKGTKFSFDSPTSPPGQNPDLSQKVTEHLADEAFARPADESPEPVEPPRPRTITPAVAPASGHASPSLRSPPPTVDVKKTASAPPKPSEMSRASAIIIKNPELQAISAQSTQRYTSTATGSSPPLGIEKRGAPIWRVPSADHHRSTSLPRQPDNPSLRVRADEPRAASPRIINSLQPPQHQASSSSRPSLEGGRPSAEYLGTVPSAKTSQRERPASTHLESSLDFLRERQNASKNSPSPLPSPGFLDQSPSPGLPQEEETNIESNVEFLRSIEESNAKKDRSSWHIKKSSVSSTSSGSKNIFAGKFGDAFKRFEQQPASRRTPSPQKELDRRDLTPIAGSEATDGRSDDGRAHDIDELSPERRREMERLQLEEEERRVEAAQAEYRQRKAAQGQSGKAPALPPKPAGGSSRAISIQNRMQSLLDESQRGPVTRTAQGYGVYSDTAHASSRVEKQLPEIPRKPISTMPPPQTRDQDIIVNKLRHPSSEPLPSVRPVAGAKPPAPRKPIHLNNIPTGGSTASKPAAIAPNRPVGAGPSDDSGPSMTSREKDDYLSDFSKRFPSLSAIEMVETDIDADAGSGSRR